MTTATMPIHAAADAFPAMSDEQYAELVDDIRANGLHDPIVCTPDREILDGRHRYRACADAGVPPRYTTYHGEPWRYVISTNLHRRHLTDSQRAVIAAKVATRMRGRPENGSDDPFTPPTQAQARELLNVSETSVKRARRVERNGSDGLKAAVSTGVIPLKTAERLAQSTPAEQESAITEATQPREKQREPAVSRKPPRKPLPTQAQETGWAIRKAADKAHKITTDDRFRENTEQVAAMMRGHLAYAVETLAEIVDTLPDISESASTNE